MSRFSATPACFSATVADRAFGSLVARANCECGRHGREAGSIGNYYSSCFYATWQRRVAEKQVCHALGCFSAKSAISATTHSRARAREAGP
jgi:hypothetical protein